MYGQQSRNIDQVRRESKLGLKQVSATGLSIFPTSCFMKSMENEFLNHLFLIYLTFDSPVLSSFLFSRGTGVGTPVPKSPATCPL